MPPRKARAVKPTGQIRQSQVVTTFGPGSMIDLPEHSVIVGGLEHWGDPAKEGFLPIEEDRLTSWLKKHLNLTAPPRLYAPPAHDDTEGARQTGITVFQFPEWFVATDEQSWGEGAGVRSRRLVHRRGLKRGKFENIDKKSIAVVPMRFVQACINGHVSDIDWYGFAHAHADGHACRNSRKALWLDERGTTGDLADVFVRCECKASRALVTAITGTGDGQSALGFCQGDRPWLGKGASELCGGEGGKKQPNKLLVRSASNAYFAQVVSVISLPNRDEELRKVVDRLWDDYFQVIEEASELKRERRKAKVTAALGDFTDDAIFAEIERKRFGAGTDKSIKQAEVETLLSSPAQMGEDSPDTDFYARTASMPAPVTGPMTAIDRIVLVHRLREVVAQVGFTRFESAAPDIDGELQLDVRRAQLAREVSWLPAIENRGEGIFIAFKAKALADWSDRPSVKARLGLLRDGWNAWKLNNPESKMQFPGPRYLLLHSLSHLLITAVSLECGYSASSIRERIYATDAGAGILLHTGTSDAEGTLGGLVQVGRHLERHIMAALELGRLCSNDPVCAQHLPDNRHEARYLLGAACHGCLLIAEPSCEHRNDFLDRALVIPTVEHAGAEFFRSDGV